MLPGLTPNPGAAAGGGSVASELDSGSFGGVISSYSGHVFKVISPAVDGDFTSLTISMSGRPTAGEDTKVDAMYVGIQAASGDEYDADSLTQVQVSASNSWTVNDQVNNDKVSDSVSLSGSSGDRIVISFYLGTGSADHMGQNTSATGWDTWKKVTSDASIANDSGYNQTTVGGNDVCALIQKLTFS